MSPDIGTMRAFVYQMYKSDRWHRRVKRMRDNEITAIYLKQQAKAVKAEKKRHDKPDDIPF